MKRFIPYEKLSKKAKRQLDSQRRATWGELNPITRRPESPKVYNRKKHLRTDEPGGGAFFRDPLATPKTPQGFLLGVGGRALPVPPALLVSCKV